MSRFMRYVIVILAFLLVLFIGYKIFDKKEADELVSSKNEVREIKEDDLLEIKAGMTYEEIIKKLGKTNDLKTDAIEYHIVKYYIGEKEVSLVFKKYTDKTLLSGKEMLERARYINPQDYVVTGVISELSENGFLLTSKTNEKEIISVTVNTETVFIGFASLSELKNEDSVEVEFAGPIAESYPAQGTASRISKR